MAAWSSASPTTASAVSSRSSAEVCAGYTTGSRSTAAACVSKVLPAEAQS